MGMLLTSTGEGFFQLLIVLFCFVVVLILTYYTTRWIAGYQKSHSFNKNLHVVETLKLTTNKYIQIIQVGDDRYFVIALGKEEVSLIGEISKEELRDLSEENLNEDKTETANFQDVLGKFKDYLPKSRHEK